MTDPYVRVARVRCLACGMRATSLNGQPLPAIVPYSTARGATNNPHAIIDAETNRALGMCGGPLQARIERIA